MEETKKEKKCPFFKMFTLCFPFLKSKKKPTPEQQEIIDIVNETVDQIQEQIEEYLAAQTEEPEQLEQLEQLEQPEEQPEEQAEQ